MSSKKDRSGATPPPFNAPFKQLKGLLKAPPPAPPAPPAPARAPRAAEPVRDEELFEQAMAGVERLPDDHGRAPPPPPRPATGVDDEAEGLARLSELVSGEGPFDISDTSEFIEGIAPGVDRRLLKKLRQGEFALQGHLDLHGLVRSQAKHAVDQFLASSRREGKRCVLLIHGRGLNSKDQIPVLKEHLKLWLNQGRLGRSVLAFATARPHDGGAGALYVLLRR